MEKQVADKPKLPRHQHQWPQLNECFFGPWAALTKDTQYRQCVHPLCHEYEERETPK